ncbi:undecaprenyl-diphosphate phosphatase [Parvularcula dongshanensis]|uniref:Undecaprenyl-diphosphatase n=1 Tax=Parvularcula dongshanensis TaxID=1173995 RepID=A0A840I6A1_9PROT|nr:undecaprenyl-diphosphate phosphatase [Parvularcula dongshanensis]MBB4659540.1 undecaprenyl-diphosphatase [Parvularcula dongshanensis]
MLLLQLVLLAIVQGLTEFIPVSSSAHLILPAQLFEGFQDQGTGIDIAAHIGSLGAVMLYFRTEVAGLFRGGADTLRGRATDDQRLLWLLIAGTVPFLIAGAIFAFSGLADAVRSPIVIAWASIGWGIVLWLTDRRPERIDHIPTRFGPATLIGAAQCLALVPGTSRSGITITAARALGYDRTQAARFSMLLSIPTIAASGLFLLFDLFGEGAGTALGPALIVAGLSFGTAYASIAVFLRMTESVSFTPFVLYRIALGVVLLAIFT